MEQLTVGMIGLSHPHSLAHLRTFDASARVRGVALYDPDAGARERAAGECRKAGKAYASLDDLLARTDVPVVCVALPNNEVPEVAARCARSGKHILCEKPCARSAGEVQPVLEALATHQVQFCVYYVWRRNPAILRMQELVQAGAIGRLTSVELRMVTTQVRFRDPSHWLFKREVAGGGVLSWLGCHWLDLLRFVTGQEVESVSALMGTLSGEDISVEDAATVSMRLSGGALASLHAGYLLASGRAGYESPAYDMTIILRGTEGTLSHPGYGDEQALTLESAAAGSQTAPRQVYHYTLPQSPAYGGAHGLAFVEQFLVAALEGKGSSPAGAEDALRVLEILDAIYISAEQERVVHLGRGE